MWKTLTVKLLLYLLCIFDCVLEVDVEGKRAPLNHLSLFWTVGTCKRYIWARRRSSSRISNSRVKLTIFRYPQKYTPLLVYQTHYSSGGYSVTIVLSLLVGIGICQSSNPEIPYSVVYQEGKANEVDVCLRLCECLRVERSSLEANLVWRFVLDPRHPHST